MPSFDAGEAPRRSTSSLGNRMNQDALLLLVLAVEVLLFSPMVIGIILAIRYRRRWPWTARLVVPGLLALAGNVVGSIAVRHYAQRLHFAIYEDASVAAQHLAIMRSVLVYLNFIGIGLVTAAVFADRGTLRIGRLTIGSSDRGARLRWAKEGVDDLDKSTSL